MQFSRISPEVISIAKGDILAHRPGDYIYLVSDRSDIGRMRNQFDAFRILERILLDYRPRGVRRAILSNQDFKLKIGFLHQKTLQCPGDILFMIIGDAADAHHNFRFSTHHIALYSSGCRV
ncbi:hypothetical protein D3C85_1302470 [compost metagenome]